MNELINFSNINKLDNKTILDIYLSMIDVNESSKRTYCRNLKSWIKYLSSIDKTILDADKFDVLNYKKQISEIYKTATVNSYLTSVRNLYVWLESNKIFPNIAGGIKNLKRSKISSKDSLTVNQAKRIINRKATNLQELRNQAIANLMIRRGLRTIEIIRADIQDIRQINGNAVLYVQGKGKTDKDDFVPLSDACLEPIYSYLNEREKASGKLNPTDPLFAGIGNRNKGGRVTTRTISNIISAIFKDEGIKTSRLTAHSCRHTAVTMSLLGGSDVIATQELARHSSIDTTMIYVHNLNKVESKAGFAIDSVLDN